MPVSDFLNHNFFILLYPELGGGHHLRNLISLDRSFFPLGARSHDTLYQGLKDWYEDPTSIHTHAFPVVDTNFGHDLVDQETFYAHLDNIDYTEYKNSVHPCHAHNVYLGDLSILKNKPMLILTFKDPVSYNIINERANLRYGHHLLAQSSRSDTITEHSAYSFEKFIYSREAAVKYLRINDRQIFEVEIKDFYKQDICSIIDNINNFFNLNIPLDQAQELHNLWKKMLWR